MPRTRRAYRSDANDPKQTLAAQNIALRSRPLAGSSYFPAQN